MPKKRLTESEKALIFAFVKSMQDIDGEDGYRIAELINYALKDAGYVERLYENEPRPEFRIE